MEQEKPNTEVAGSVVAKLGKKPKVQTHNASH